MSKKDKSKRKPTQEARPRWSNKEEVVAGPISTRTDGCARQRGEDEQEGLREELARLQIRVVKMQEWIKAQG